MPRDASPPGFSTLMTHAPISARSLEQKLAFSSARSSTRISLRRLSPSDVTFIFQLLSTISHQQSRAFSFASSNKFFDDLLISLYQPLNHQGHRNYFFYQPSRCPGVCLTICQVPFQLTFSCPAIAKKISDITGRGA